MASPKTLAHQFRLAEDSAREMEHLYKAGYWAACVSHAYQVALRSAAGLLYGIGTNPMTEREVRVAFASAFISTEKSQPTFDQAFRALERLRQRADFDHDHTTTQAEATQALDLARAFWSEARRLQKEALK